MNLSDAVMQYIADRKSKGARPNTIRNEKYQLELLLADVGNLQVGHLRAQHIDLFWSRRTTWGNGTMNLARSNLSSFVKWCQIRGYIKRDQNPLEGGRQLRVAPRKRITIPQQEFETFLDGISDPRARAMCAIGLYLFTRISETAALRWQDVDTHGGTVEVYRDKTQTIDTLPLCEELSAEMRRWSLSYAAELGRPLQPADLVIPAFQQARTVGKPGAKGVWIIAENAEYLPRKKAHITYSVKRALLNADYYQTYEGGHTLRRSGAIALYNQLTSVGHDRAIRVCQAMLGHSTIRTTEVYLRLDLDRKVRNDLLAGKPMFPERAEAEVIQLRGAERAEEPPSDAQNGA